uniref:CCHC NOA-type domain-containing protein n=1 Tax=Taeniopygia guttata TaxID=59729 RepID=A0A674GV59_TAEGU
GRFPRGRTAAAEPEAPAGGTGDTWGHLGTWGQLGTCPCPHEGGSVPVTVAVSLSLSPAGWQCPCPRPGGSVPVPMRVSVSRPCPQQDKAQVQAQVTSLLGELRESQNRLERSRAEREHLERRARGDAERCHQLEEVAQGHQVQLDQLRLQVTNLETALRVERHGATEEKRKLVQLQAAYHHLFQEYDAHIKASLEGDKRSQQLRAAEAALALKQELIDRLKAEAERQRAALETIPVLQAQVGLGDPKPALSPPNPPKTALSPPNPPKPALTPQNCPEPPKPPQTCPEPPKTALTPQNCFGGLLPPPEEGPDLCCPKCQYKAPDMDTLQIHVMDCIK